MRYLCFAILLGCIQIAAIVISGEDIDSLNTIMRIVRASFAEPIFIMSLLCLLKGHFANRAMRGMIRLLGVLYLLVFLSECYYFSVSGEWITLLALANINQAHLIADVKYIFVLLVFLVILLFYVCLIDNCDYIRLTKRFKIVLLTLVLTGLGTAVYLSPKFYYLPPKFIAPISSLLVNIKKMNSEYTDVDIKGYPFEKNYIYKNPLPFDRISKKQPNIIILFSEGTSARLIGAYNGNRFKNLTPNIDAFTKKSMRVDNYFNHTVATFRGTFGQLASAFSLEGGWTKGGVTAKEDSRRLEVLRNRNVQSLPRLLNNSYETVFFSPHKREDPYTDLLQTLNFNTIYTCNEINKEFFDNNAELFSESIKDDDMYYSLRRFMETYNKNKPFFVAMYTFDTHLGLKLPQGSKEYVSELGNVEALNSLHALDNAFGKFWDWFYNSDFKDNTIIVFTADHAHYHETSYVNIVKKDSDYRRFFIDKIPLVIYDPVHKLPESFDAQDRTSLDITPTLCHLLEIQEKNSFLGSSLFDAKPADISIAVDGETFYGIYDHKVWREKEIEQKYQPAFDKMKNNIMLFYVCLKSKRVFH